MKNLFIFFGILLLILIFTYNCYAGGYGTTSGLFLKMPVGAAPTAMGGAYTAIANDINSLYWNPAGLGFVKFKEATFTYNNYLEDLAHSYLAYCQPIEALKGAIGINISLLDYGDFDKTLIDGGVTPRADGTFDAKDLAVGVSYGRSLTKEYKIGSTLKYISSELDDAKAKAFAIDLGVSYVNETQFAYPLKLAFVIQNLGTKLKYDAEKEDLPQLCKLGIGSVIELNKNFKIIPDVDLVYTKGDEFNYNIGSELNYLNSFFLRVGYDDANDAGTGLSFGAGCKLNNLSIDYAYTDYKDLGEGHRVSITYKFMPASLLR